MTDNEIIKNFRNCVYKNKPMLFGQKFLESVLDLINRQKAKIEKIKADLKYYLETNEENGVVYIPKFIIDNLVKEMTEVEE